MEAIELLFFMCYVTEIHYNKLPFVHYKISIKVIYTLGTVNVVILCYDELSCFGVV